MVVTGTVFYKGDQLGRTSFFPAKFFIHHLAKQVNQINIGPFVIPPDVVGVARRSLVIDQINCPGMVNYKQPIAYVLPFSVNWNGFVIANVINRKRDKLLGKLSYNFV